MAELNEKKRVRAGHKGSATKLIAKIIEELACVDLEKDRNVLRQLKDSLADKIAAIKELDDAIIELMCQIESEEADEQLAIEIEETDNTRA